MSKIEVDTIDTQTASGTLQVGSTNTSLIKIGTSGDTVEYPAGTTFTQSGTQNVTSGGAINVKSGGSIIIESGAAITNNGTATGFSADLTNLNATNLTSGTVPDARFPATLPAANGSALTNLNATNLGSGTVPDARFPATLPAVSGANLTNLPASGITEADQWRKSAVQEFTTADITANLERVDDANYGKIGTGMSESSGTFSFPSTGTYMVMVNAAFYSVSGAGDSRYIILRTQITTNNSSYSNVAMAITNNYNFQNNVISQNASSIIYFNVTDTSNCKVKFTLSSATPSGYFLQGTTGDNQTTFTFIRLGDST